ncbi:hypothetical protein R1sor_014186 [Riccia sorocarpa]|uniref:Uncharacterized protein n=1 Tax=Riccia sorocarpa TaxID=122646 RepID=A0ABD3HBA4_9MARC
MVRGFQSFRESMGVAGPVEGPGRTGGTLYSSTKEALRMVFAPEDILADARDNLPFFLDLLPGVATAAQRFILILLQRQALRFADDLDGTSSVDAWNKDAMAAARGIQPLRSFFSFLPRDRVD